MFSENPMKNEVYSANPNSQVLEHGKCHGFNYYIVSYSSHPCCYVEIPKDHMFFGVHYDVINEFSNVCCHGGLTYSEDSLFNLKDSWFIGWDYAHLDDFYMRDYTLFGEDCGYHYSLDELRDEVRNVCSVL